MVKVLVVSTVDLDKNGIVTCIMNYFEQTVSSEVSMDIVAPNIVDSDLKERIFQKGMTLYELKMRKTSTLRYFWNLKRIIKSQRYDVVHVHGNSCTMAIELCSALLGGCRTRIAHSHNTACQHIHAHKILRPVFELCCNKRFACGREAGQWLFKEKSFKVIKNGVDLKRYHPCLKTRNEFRKKLGIDEDTIVIGHIGLFNYQKNHEFLIEIATQLEKRKNLKFLMLLIGDGELKSNIEEKVYEKQLEKRVLLTGNITNVSDYLQVMDVFMLPSRYEGLPYVLVEAQASGLPCVVSEQVSKDANLTDTMTFIPIESTEPWIKHLYSIIKPDMYIERQANIDKYHRKITDMGYDISTNAKLLKEMYIKRNEK